MGLVVAREAGESLTLSVGGVDVVVTVCDKSTSKNGQPRLRLHVEAPPEVKIWRGPRPWPTERTLTSNRANSACSRAFRV